MNNYTLYAHKNKINDKIYIGQTKQKPEKRWGNNGEGYKTSNKFYLAIQKYGWDNFDHLILATNLTQDMANYLEEYYISFYGTTDDRFGYNITTGGKNFSHSEETKKKIGEANAVSLKGIKHSDAQNKKMSELFKGEGNPFYGKKHSDETKKKISESRKGKRTGLEHPMYGKKHSEDALEKMSQNRKGKGGKNVLCVNTGEVFNCMMDAARWCGLSNSSSIGAVCRGEQKTAGKHPKTKERLVWKYVN